MRKAENVNAPSLGGWLIGAAAGLVAFGALLVVGKFDIFPAAALGAVVAVLVGLVLGMTWGGRAASPLNTSPVAKGQTPPAYAAPVPQAEVASASGQDRLAAPREGAPDNLKEIEGIGPAMEKVLNSLGFFHFDQIARWTDADVALIEAEMQTFRGRISRDKWVAQARIIAADGLDAFRIRAKANDY